MVQTSQRQEAQNFSEHNVISTPFRVLNLYAGIGDIVQVKTIDNNKAHIIGSRGRGYEGFDHKIDNFIFSCISCDLHYVVPQSCA